MFQYFILNYFFTRGDSGSIFVRIHEDVLLQKGYMKLSDDEIIEEAVKSNQLNPDFKNNVTDIEPSDESEYNAGKGIVV